MPDLPSNERRKMSYDEQTNDGLDSSSKGEPLPERPERLTESKGSDAAESSVKLPEPDDIPTTGAPTTGAEPYARPTICHKPEIGLRASQICKVCNGDLAQPYGVEAANAVNSPPIENTVMLPCMHWALVLHSRGDRLVRCQQCGLEAIVRAKEIRTIRYVVDAVTTRQTTLQGFDVGI
jgi:hypothetical protein